MNLDEYFGKSEGGFPAKGSVGVEGNWIEIGVLAVTHGTLWVGDFYAKNKSDGCVVNVPTGAYRAEVKGMDFAGHRRVARVRICPVDQPDLLVADMCGEISVDCGMVRLFDVAAFEAIIFPQHSKQFAKDILAAAEAAYFESYGIGCATYTYAAGNIDAVFLPSGLGDGTYRIYPMVAQDRVLGMEVEFLPPNYSPPRKTL